MSPGAFVQRFFLVHIPCSRIARFYTPPDLIYTREKQVHVKRNSYLTPYQNSISYGSNIKDKFENFITV